MLAVSHLSLKRKNSDRILQKSVTIAMETDTDEDNKRKKIINLIFKEIGLAKSLTNYF
jgi:hypothetical protein